MGKSLLKLLGKVWIHRGNLHSYEKCINIDCRTCELECVFIFPCILRPRTTSCNFSIFSTLPSTPGKSNETVMNILNLYYGKFLTYIKVENNLMNLHVTITLLQYSSSLGQPYFMQTTSTFPPAILCEYCGVNNGFKIQFILIT